MEHVFHGSSPFAVCGKYQPKHGDGISKKNGQKHVFLFAKKKKRISI
jgi:hypothetical protein